MLTTYGLRELKLSATKCQLMLGSVAESQSALARCETSVDAALCRTTEEPGSTCTHGTNEKRSKNVNSVTESYGLGLLSFIVEGSN